MQTVFYSTLCLSSREQIFLRSVLVMYNTRNNAIWEESNADAEVIVLGKDVTSEHMLSIPNNIKVILSFNSEIQKIGYDIFYVSTPIKATELIEKINMSERALLKSPNEQIDPPPVKQVEHISEKVRLLKWPNSEILRKDRNYPVLSTLLSKCAMNLEELAAISSKPDDVCRAFIAQIVESGDAEYVNATITPVKVVEQKQKPAPKKGLLDRIRISLGIFQK